MFNFFKIKLDTDELFRKIVESTSVSFDINKIRKTIVDTIGKALNADRCFIMEYDKIYDRFIESREEYLSSNKLPSYLGVDLNEKIPNFAVEFKKGKQLIFNINSAKLDNEDIDLKKGCFEQEQAEIDKYKVYSAIIIPLFYAKEFLGDLVIHYTDQKHEAVHEEINLLNTVKGQIAIILYQAKLYDQMKTKTERESFLRNIIQKIRISLDIEEILSFICQETAKIFDVQRCAIASFIEKTNHEDFVIRKEYKSSEDIRGVKDDEHFFKAASYVTSIVYKNEFINIENVETSDTPDNFKSIYKKMGVKSLIGISIRKGEDLWGTLVLSDYKNIRKWTEEDKALLTTIRDQIYIAATQAELYQTVKNTATNEKILRDIMLSFVQTLEMKDLMKNIVTQVGQLLKADRCFFIGTDPETFSNLPVQHYAEYLSSSDIKSHTERTPEPDETSVFIKASQQQKVIYADNIDEVELPEPTRKMLVDDLGVKSYLIAPVYYGDIRYGGIVLHYVDKIKKFSSEEVDIIMAIANQAAIVIHQSDLFEQQKNATERERMNKNIIEILRSSIDKDIIKKLFVKNIGKFFEADRVLFAEYDETQKKYLPADINSEYLSNTTEKSLVGFDWSAPEVSEFIQPLLEKRELCINNLYGYLEKNPKSEEFKKFFEDYTIKSSYNFPVLHQQTLVGFFCLDYMQETKDLSEEDINRIRSICTQAGIAFYHASLYEQIHSGAQAQSEFLIKTSAQCVDAISEIVEISDKLLNSDYEKELFIDSITEMNHISKDVLKQVESCRNHLN